MDRQLLEQIAADAGIPLDPDLCIAVSGGDISAAFKVRDTDGGAWFLKTNTPEFAEAFAAECDGLRELERAAQLRVPHPVATGATADSAWLLLDWLDLSPGGDADAALGSALAAMHRITADQHGWQRDNFIGAMPQLNTPHAEWAAFFRWHRLMPQLQLAELKGAPVEFLLRGQALAANLGALLAGHEPRPSLLHGDLWAGNRGCLADGSPVLFDPAVYFGDRETDLAMTRLFGGFGPDFYRAYDAAWPPDPGRELRLTLYQLYHVLNHFNMFGGAYLAQADRMMAKLLAA